MLVLRIFVDREAKYFRVPRVDDSTVTSDISGVYPAYDTRFGEFPEYSWEQHLYTHKSTLLSPAIAGLGGGRENPSHSRLQFVHGKWYNVKLS